MNFQLDKEQLSKAVGFENAHAHPDNNEGAIGGRFTYSFTNTGLGIVAEVSCSMCKADLNLTNFSDW